VIVSRLIAGSAEICRFRGADLSQIIEAIPLYEYLPHRASWTMDWIRPCRSCQSLWVRWLTHLFL